ncbi:LysM peptidoglycan-binding domain-containing protein [Spirochaeta isovalerica]|uniref:LysM repeat protein n=1 Tax=Spirochaeta isovalerica TaxID=150 RepID=A0A841R8Y6_9SPIO|nr:LysM peptidoglycan-binding domain-containing protein [Spirochaeta isovalerica]MBB6480256.1 LysM repeat protein [Spirochaeta isovalerica]
MLFADQIIHKVDERDTLFGLSLLYNTSVDDIRRANGLESEIIKKGEELVIPLPDSTVEVSRSENKAEIHTYRVKNGDTLSEIALKLGVEQKQIEQLNHLSDQNVRIGQVLSIPGKAAGGDRYSVQSGDTLSRISLLFDISQEQLRQINNLENDSLRVGQSLLVAPLRPQVHLVEKGDNLWDIAAAYDLAIEDISKWNNINGSSIYPGQELKLYSRTVENFEFGASAPSVLMASYREKTPAEPLEEYSHYREEKSSQPTRNYSESRLDDPVLNYRQARDILEALDRSIESEPGLGNQLSGYTIVIDPGHGGLDPGAIVASVNGNGETVYVVEDEYAYDISLRTYRLLKLYGADVTLTIISPNHQIRSSENPSDTFVNMKNEVYNMASLNRKNDDSSWPVGSSEGLRKRVEIAENAFRGADRNKTLYISIHADNSPDLGQGTIVLYSSENEANLDKSQELAESLIPYLGASSSTGRQNLAVLRDNPAYAEVLIEIRNLYYPGNSWAIRYDKLREQDAEFITRGLINYAEGR